MNVFENNRFIKILNFFFIFNILPPEFFLKIRPLWVALVGFWIKIILFYFFILHLGEPQTTCFCLLPKIDSPSECLQDSLPPDLKVLWLDNNQIERFQQTDINYFDGLVNRTSLRLKLGNNPYACSCDSKENI